MSLLRTWSRLSRSERLGWACVAIGLAGAAVVQLASRLPSPPLYDGIFVEEPYLWLAPPPNHPGGAEGADATIPVKGGRNEPLAVATPELTPQAQILAVAGALTILPSATSIRVSIAPIPSRAPPDGSYIDGNTYRIDVTDQAGNPVTAPASDLVSIVLRSADPALQDASINRFDGRRWQPLETSSAGTSGFFAIVTEFGEFAVVAHGVSAYATGTPSASDLPVASGASPPPSTGALSSVLPLAIAVGVLLGVALLAVLVGRRRRRRRRGRDLRKGWGP